MTGLRGAERSLKKKDAEEPFLNNSVGLQGDPCIQYCAVLISTVTELRGTVQCCSARCPSFGGPKAQKPSNP